jgi:hypothetical protein
MLAVSATAASRGQKRSGDVLLANGQDHATQPRGGQRTVKTALNFQAAADAKRYIVPKNMAIVINVTDIGL